MKTHSFNDLLLFALVADEGSLSHAASRSDMSVATLSRRIVKLETEFGQQLFHRSPAGYIPTHFGFELLEQLTPMREAANRLTSWLEAPQHKSRVVISAGTWTACHLASNFDHLSVPGDTFQMVLVSTEERLKIGYREIDPGLRNAPPTEFNLASQRLRHVEYAVFAARNVREPLPWVTLVPENPTTPTARWMSSQNLQPIAASCSDPRTMLDLVQAGVGKSVFPIFIAECCPGLAQIGPIIPELSSEQWLVMHDETRHLPHVRQVIRRLVDLYAE